jgi:methylmalonyl-CoA mutase N-terminal domain/subunit
MSRPLDRITPQPQAAPGDIGAAAQLWQERSRAPFVAQHPERRQPFLTQALKWPIKPLYTPADLEAAGFDYLRIWASRASTPTPAARSLTGIARTCGPCRR